MKKKKIYTNKNIAYTSKNQNICEVQEKIVDEKNMEKNMEKNETCILKKIDELFSTNGYIFNIDVKIITLNKVYDTKIVSIVGKYIITMDGDIISMDDIKDIIF